MKDKWLLSLTGGFVFALLLNAVPLKTLTGIPAHPLLLHIPVITVPTLAIAAIVFAAKPVWRTRYDIAYGIGAIVAMAGTILTANAGETWRDMLDAHDRMAINDHAELGDKLKVVVMIFVSLIIVQIAIDRGAVTKLKAAFDDARSAASVGLSVLIVAFAIGAGVLTVLTGHAGAKAVFGKDGELGSQYMQSGAQGQKPPGDNDGY